VTSPDALGRLPVSLLVPVRAAERDGEILLAVRTRVRPDGRVYPPFPFLGHGLCLLAHDRLAFCNGAFGNPPDVGGCLKLCRLLLALSLGLRCLPGPVSAYLHASEIPAT